MKRRIAIILALMTLCIGAAAQGVKSMNQIKRNPTYLYAEATMETVAEAYDVASELLYLQAKEYATGKKSFKNKDILLRNIKAQEDSIQMRRGDMYKVFLYIKKSDVISVDNVTVIEGDRKSADSPDGGAVVATETVSGGKSPSGGGADASLKLPVHWQQSLVDELLAEPSLASAKAKLGRFKAEFKVKNTGPLSTCKNLPGAFLLIGKDGKVVTILGPGDNERTEFKTLTKTNLNNYSSMDILWFTLAK